MLTSAPSLKVRILRRCLHQQRLRMSTFKDVVEVSTVLECVLLKAVLTSAPSLKVCIQRRCLPQQRLRMPTFKDVAKISTVFESCSLSKTVFWDPSLKFLSFDDVTFNDVRKTTLYPLFDRRRIAFF